MQGKGRSALRSLRSVLLVVVLTVVAFRFNRNGFHPQRCTATITSVHKPAGGEDRVDSISNWCGRAGGHLPPQVTPRIVLLPGLDGTGIAYRTLQSCLAPTYTVAVSYSDRVGGYRADLETARGCLQQTGPYILVAESYSGLIAVSLAAERPPGLVGLVLSATFLECPRPLLRQLSFMLRALPPARVPATLLAPLLLNGRSTPESRRMLAEAMRAASPRTMRGRLLDVATIDVTTDAHRVEVPTLYLRATADRLVPRSAGEGVRKHLRRVTVVELAGPHLLLQACAQEAAAEIMGFLRTVAPVGESELRQH